MEFQTQLLRGRLEKRYKRFLADVVLDDGRHVTAHCANPGAMLGLNTPGATVWLSANDNPKRKLKFSWELVEADGAIVGINTSLPNGLVAEAIGNETIKQLTGYASLAREKKYGKNSRIDLLLEDDSRSSCYVEVKNVHLMRQPGLAEFPDSVTKRGAKHLCELSGMVAAGHRAVMLYLVQRPDTTSFALAQDIDPAYAAAFKSAREAGVEAYVYDCDLSPHAITLRNELPFHPDLL